MFRRLCNYRGLGIHDCQSAAHAREIAEHTYMTVAPRGASSKHFFAFFVSCNLDAYDGSLISWTRCQVRPAAVVRLRQQLVLLLDHLSVLKEPNCSRSGSMLEDKHYRSRHALGQDGLDPAVPSVVEAASTHQPCLGESRQGLEEGLERETGDSAPYATAELRRKVLWLTRVLKNLFHRRWRWR